MSDALFFLNLAFGGDTYMRSPLNVAISTNDGETFRRVQNLAFKTYMEGYDYVHRSYLTNQSFAKVNGSDAVLTYDRLGVGKGEKINILVSDFDAWYTRTKGAYDDFEHGTVQYEGWSVVSGSAELSSINAQGKYSMKIGKNGSVVTRSMPGLQNGQISLDIYATADTTFTLALQCALNPADTEMASLIRLNVEGGKLYVVGGTEAVAELKEGWNTVTFDLTLAEDKATVAVNDGEAVALKVNTAEPDYVTYITFYADTDVLVDELLVISEDEVVLAASEEDKAAAQKVIELIKAIEKADDKVAAIEAAREAFDALTQVQADLVDGKTLVEDAFVNYYDVLVAEEAKIEEYAVKSAEAKIEAIGTVTLQSKEAIKAARAAYDKLSAEQKALVSNYKALTDAEAALKALEEAGDVIPPTGDTAPVAVMMSALFISLLAVAVLVPDIRKRLLGK